jgi:hypothetical protein
MKVSPPFNLLKKGRFVQEKICSNICIGVCHNPPVQQKEFGEVLNQQNL